MAHWYITLEDKAEKHGSARHIHLSEQEAKEWLASLRQRARANKRPRWGKSQPRIEEVEAVAEEE